MIGLFIDVKEGLQNPHRMRLLRAAPFEMPHALYHHITGAKADAVAPCQISRPAVRPA
jgi:hypothetical protein